MSHKVGASSTARGGVVLTGHFGGTADSPTVVNHSQVTGTDDLHTEYLKASGARALTGNQSFGGNKATNLGAGSDSGDAATYGQLLSFYRAMDFKDSVRVATAADLPACTYVSGVLTADANGSINDVGIDGVTTLVADDRVLVKNRGTAAENGIYVVTSAGGIGAPFVLTRSLDADTAAKLTFGAIVSVAEGTALAGHTFKMTTADPITLGTTAIAWTDMAQAISFATPIALGGSASPAAGSASTAAKSDHDHGSEPATNGDSWGSASKRWSIHAGEVYTNIRQATVNINVGAGDHVVLGEVSGASKTFTLPDVAVNEGRRLVFKKVDGSTNTVTIAGYGGTQNIEGNTSYTLTAPGESIEIVSDGSQWQIIG